MAKRIAMVLGMLGLIDSGQAQAHHSFSMFDTSREVEIKGVVKDFQWTNPHTWLVLEVKNGDREVEWPIEGASPNNLVRFGWKRTSLKPGDHVLAMIHPLKDGRIGGSMITVTVNGQVVGAPRPS
jgi:hypothetical protein